MQHGVDERSSFYLIDANENSRSYRIGSGISIKQTTTARDIRSAATPPCRKTMAWRACATRHIMALPPPRRGHAIRRHTPASARQRRYAPRYKSIYKGAKYHGMAYLHMAYNNAVEKLEISL